MEGGKTGSDDWEARLSAYVSPNTGKAMAAAHSGQLIGNHKDCMMCCFPISVTDARHNQTASTYDASGNLTRSNTPAMSRPRAKMPSLRGLHLQQRRPSDFPYLPDNGSGYRRVDQAAYYTSGPQQGYLQSFAVDGGGDEAPKKRSPSHTTRMATSPNRVDPLGNNTLYTVNALNQMVQEQSPPVSTAVPVRYTNQYAYDADDNLVSATTPGINGDGVPDDTVTGLATWTYDVLNYVTNETDRINSKQDAVTQYQYDANRNVTKVILPEAANGDAPFNIISTQYDERDWFSNRSAPQARRNSPPTV